MRCNEACNGLYFLCNFPSLQSAGKKITTTELISDWEEYETQIWEARKYHLKVGVGRLVRSHSASSSATGSQVKLVHHHYLMFAFGTRPGGGQATTYYCVLSLARVSTIVEGFLSLSLSLFRPRTNYFSFKVATCRACIDQYRLYTTWKLHSNTSEDEIGRPL